MVGQRDAVPGPEVEAAPAVRDALAALELGHDRRARSLLQAHLSHTNDTEALKLLGDVLYDLGDLPGAGAVWFALGGKGEVVGSAVEAWRTKHGDDFAKMWNSLPAGVRAEPLPPRLAALKAKADEADAARRAAAAAASAERMPEPTTPMADQGSGAPGASESGPGGRRSDRHESRPIGRDRARDADRPGARERSGNRDRDSGRDGDHDRADDAKGEQSGVDAAKLIAWVLAALFVVCAIVGLITILQWIVPGS